MTSSFNLTLDTVTHVAAAINGGKGTTEKATVTLELTLDPDAALVKIWGDINPLDPMNAGMATTEGGAEWLPATADFLVALTTNPGLKELHVRVQDDVLNEATATASITLTGEGPPVPPIEPEPTHPEPLPASGVPEPIVEPERRELVTTSAAGRILSSSVVVTSRAIAAGVGGAPRSSSAVASSTPSRSQVSTRVETSVAVRAPVPGSSLGQLPSAAVLDRRDGEDFIASLVELGIL